MKQGEVCDGGLGVDCTSGGRVAAAVRLIAALLLVAFCSLAVAQSSVPADGVPTTTTPSYTLTVPNAGVEVFGSGDEACQVAGRATYGQNTTGTFAYDAPSHGCTVDKHDGNGPGVFLYVTVGSQQTCDNSTSIAEGFSGGVYCKCNYGAAVGGSVCNASPPTCPSTVGQPVPSNGASYTWAGITSGAAGCVNGCAVYSEGTSSSPGSTPYTVGGFYSAGSTCGPGSGGAAAATAKPPAAAACTGATACAGTVNGTTVCVACGTPSTTSVTSSDTTTTNPDGSTSTTAGNTVVKSTTDNGDGTTTTTTTTTSPSGAVTTKTSTGPSASSGTGGSGTGTSGGTGSGSGTGNCTGTTCGDGTDSFGGSCSTSFTCDGDAVQCAIAQEQHQRDCAFFQPSTQAGDLGTQAGIGSQAVTDGDVPSWSPSNPANASVVGIDASSQLDSSRLLSSACPGDISMTLGGQTVAIPLSSECGSLQMVGSIVTALGYFVSALILFRRGKN